MSKSEPKISIFTVVEKFFSDHKKDEDSLSLRVFTPVIGGEKKLVFVFPDATAFSNIYTDERISLENFKGSKTCIRIVQFFTDLGLKRQETVSLEFPNDPGLSIFRTTFDLGEENSSFMVTFIPVVVANNPNKRDAWSDYLDLVLKCSEIDSWDDFYDKISQLRKTIRIFYG